MRLLRHALSLWGLLLLGTGLFAQSSKLSPDVTALLNDPNAPRNASVVVQFNLLPGQTAASLARGMAGQTNAAFDLIPAASKSMPLWSIRGLVNNPNVAYVSLDRPVAGALEGASDYSHLAVGADLAAGYGLTGAGVGVAILDSGISAHPDLASKVVYRESFVETAGDGKITSSAAGTSDEYGHGTHVAGVVAGSGAASRLAVHGVAPGVMLVDLQVLDANGMSSDGTILAALDRAVKLSKQFNIRIINLSLGRPIYESYRTDPLTRAVEAAWKRGIVVVVAAGNYGRYGYATVLSPGNSPAVITVGAMKTLDTPSTGDDAIASYSSKAPPGATWWSSPISWRRAT